MMMAMFRPPPQDTLLRGRLRQTGEDKLKSAVGLVGAVREIAVEEARHREHADEVERDGREHGRPAPAGPDHPQATEVEEEEWEGAHPLDLFRLVLEGQGAARDEIGVHPLRHGCLDVVEDTDEDVVGHGSQTVFR